jgi:hypothetical protein
MGSGDGVCRTWSSGSGRCHCSSLHYSDPRVRLLSGPHRHPLPQGECLTSSGPWWLVRVGRLEDAKKQLTRLASEGYYTDEKLDQIVALMKHTDEMEKAERAGAGFGDCFRGANKRRTEIVRDIFRGLY